MEMPAVPTTFVGVTRTDMKENTFIEFKHNFNPAVKKNSKKYQQTICAFLNTKGGILFFGIEDDGEVSGIPNGHKAIDAIRLFCDNVIRCCLTTNCGRLPYEVIHVYEIPFTADKSVVAVKCTRPASETNIYRLISDETAYYRANASTLKYVLPDEPEFKSASASLQALGGYLSALDIEKRNLASKVEELTAELESLRHRHTLPSDAVVITIDGGIPMTLPKKNNLSMSVFSIMILVAMFIVANIK